MLITNAEVTESGKGHLAYEIALCQQDTVVSIIRKRYSNFANLRSLLLHTQAAEAALSGATVQGTEDAFMQASAADAAAAAAVAAGDLAAARASALHELLKLLPFPAKSWRSVRTTAVMPPPPRRRLVLVKRLLTSLVMLFRPRGKERRRPSVRGSSKAGNGLFPRGSTV